MPKIHDPAFRESLKSRVSRLQQDAPRKWGKMSADQMLWHVNRGLENALGRFPMATVKMPLPGTLMKFVVLNVPWRKGNTPTAPELVAQGTHDFDAERSRLLRLLDEFAAKPIEGHWGDSAFLGRMKGSEWSRLMGKHVDYHLKQFSA